MSISTTQQNDTLLVHHDRPLVLKTAGIAGDFTTIVTEEAEMPAPAPSPNPAPQPSPAVKDYGRFETGGTYAKGSGEAIVFVPGPDFPAGGWVTFQTWAGDQGGRIIAGNSDRSAPFWYLPESLTAIADGRHEVQALIRDAGGGIVQTVRQTIEFTSQTAPQPVSADASVKITVVNDGIMARGAIHLHGTASTVANGRVDQARFVWSAPTASTGKVRRGYNASFVFDEPGMHVVWLAVTDKAGKVTRNQVTVSVAPDVRRRVSRWQDIRDDTVWELSGDVELTDGQIINAGYRNVLIDLKGHAVRYVGARRGSPVVSMSSATRNAMIRGGTIASIYKDRTMTRTDGIAVDGVGVAIVDVRFDGVYTAIMGNRVPDGVHVERCRPVDDMSLSGYFCWGEGSNWTFYDCQTFGGVHQAMVRFESNGSGPVERVAFDGCDFSSREKTTVTLQWARWGAFYNCDFRGRPTVVGPMSDPTVFNLDGGKIRRPYWQTERTENVVYDDCRWHGVAAGVQAGSTNITILGGSHNGASIHCQRAVDSRLAFRRIVNLSVIDHAFVVAANPIIKIAEMDGFAWIVDGKPVQ